jgi:uncharacterized membrane protein YkoI
MNSCQEANMKRVALICGCAIALMLGASSLSKAQDYNDQYQSPDNGYQDNRDMQNRGMDALRGFLGNYNNQSNNPVPPEAIVRELERRDFHRISDPVQHGRMYLVYAVDPNGQDVELSIDAYDGRIVRSRYRS